MRLVRPVAFSFSVRVALLMAAVACLGLGSARAEGHREIRGQVLGRSSPWGDGCSPLIGPQYFVVPASVRIEKENGDFVAQVLVDGDGYFTASGLKPGTYRVTAQAEVPPPSDCQLYLADSRIVELHKKENTAFTFYLWLVPGGVRPPGPPWPPGGWGS